MAAPGMTAPVASVTRPTTLADGVYANAVGKLSAVRRSALAFMLDSFPGGLPALTPLVR
jgi:hypothetical protein